MGMATVLLHGVFLKIILFILFLPNHISMVFQGSRGKDLSSGMFITTLFIKEKKIEILKMCYDRGIVKSSHILMVAFQTVVVNYFLKNNWYRGIIITIC